GVLRLTLPPRSATLAVLDTVGLPACEPLTLGTMTLRKRPAQPAKIVLEASFTTSAAFDVLDRGLALYVADGSTILAAGRLGGPDATLQFAARGSRALYVDPAGSVAGVTRALVIPRTVQPDGRRRWLVKLKLGSSAAAALAPPAVPQVQVRLDGDPPCASTLDGAVSCRWRNADMLRCSAAAPG
ncbi:hypothetical protein K2Z84_30290, partial [Candidatus Binatia bacterium]|nr:hypothetical protein [Candidatus Binatia bacterium]